ncbi:hypothetical protein [Occallatibacter savannae]|uniref:hypothetical protein n=1 Tax=Occallatibacter savannae TaxID=1002691 RepID=UPI000D694518|nr:hypothetical protein [Occallatibacter savannae]
MRVMICVVALGALSLATPEVATAAPPTEACTLLTAADVSSALGASVAEGTYIMPSLKKTCTWNIQTGGSVTLNLQSLDFFNAGKGSMASAERSAASGVGDEAYFLGVGPTTGLMVKKGSGAFKVSVYSKSLNLDQRKTVEMKLAQKVAGKF